MKEIKINCLKLTNFKGVKDFELVVNGEDVRVYGDNATGKTTLFDAFLWLLFDKDSQNKKDFGIKTLENGKEKNMIDHEVECGLTVDNVSLTLRKVYREKWTQKRGSITKEFSGHETDYFMDGTPLKKGEFNKRIETIVEEEIFKLLTSPSYFNEQVKWQDRRKILLSIVGEVSNTEIFKSNNELKGLELILKGKSMEDFRMTVNARRKAINDELDRIPIRINEIEKSIPEGDGNVPELRKEVAQLDNEIEDLQGQVSAIKNGNAVLTKQGDLQKIEMEIQNLKHELESGSKDEVYRLRAKLQEEHSNLQTFQSHKRSAEGQLQFNQDNVQRVETRLMDLRNQWHNVNGEQFTHEVECECPACGQELPEEKVHAAKEKAVAQFNARKSEELRKITQEGERGKTEKKKYQNEIERLQKEIDDLIEPIVGKEKAITKIKEELHTAENSIQDVEGNQEYRDLQMEAAHLRSDIAELNYKTEEAIGSVQEEIAEKKIRRDNIHTEIARYANVKGLRERIRVLKEEEEQLAAEFEKLEHNLYLTDEFIRAKVRIMEERINAKFQFARFKLFKTNINGGLEEMCEALYDGVPYTAGLNNAARINVGLDIINTLSEFHGIQAPIFVDNAEAVTKLIDTEAQLISLVVSEPDKKLRVENIELEEAI